MGSYLFDLGNSNDGPIGMVLRVNATTRAEAVDIACKALNLVTGDCGDITLRLPTEIKEQVEYITIYLNPSVITEKDVSALDSDETISFRGPVDWKALAQQKRWLLNHVHDTQEAAGLVELLDAIQDAAVDKGGVPQELVFPDLQENI